MIYLILLPIVLGIALALWAAPTPSVRGTPPGKKLTDGFPTTVSFGLSTTVNLWEVDAKPPGWDGGEPINIDTMLNTTYNMMAPRQLKKMTPVTMNAAYNPNCYTIVQSTLINKNGSISVYFPDGSVVTFWGFLKSFEPTDLKEGGFPVAACVIIPTMYDSVNGVEAGPVYTFASGT